MTKLLITATVVVMAFAAATAYAAVTPIPPNQYVHATGATGNVIWGTRVLLNAGEPRFHGRLGSGNPSCERHRKVRIVRFSDRRVIGVTTGNRFGKWKLPRPQAHGTFRARVGQSRELRPGVTCAGGGRSRFIRFD